MSIQRTWIRIW